MPEIVKDQRTNEWFAARRGLVTSSIAAGLISLDEYKGPQAAWTEINRVWSKEMEDKKGKSIAIQHGIANEDDAVAAYERKTGNKVQRTGFWVSDECNWLGSSPDGLTSCPLDGDGLVEIKCPSCLDRIDEFGETQVYGIDDRYLIQMLVHMVVTRRGWCDFYAWSSIYGDTDSDWLKRVYLPKQEIVNNVMAKLFSVYATFRSYENRGEKIPRYGRLKPLTRNEKDKMSIEERWEWIAKQPALIKISKDNDSKVKKPRKTKSGKSKLFENSEDQNEAL